MPGERDVPRMHATATFASPKCSECVPQQHLQVRCAQNACHSNICKSEVPRIHATATPASPMFPECMPQQHLQGLGKCSKTTDPDLQETVNKTLSLVAGLVKNFSWRQTSSRTSLFRVLPSSLDLLDLFDLLDLLDCSIC